MLITKWKHLSHYSDVIMYAMASQITSLTIVYSTVYSGTDQRKHQSYASLAFVRGIHWSPVNSPHKRPVTWKMLPFDDVIMHHFNDPNTFVIWFKTGSPNLSRRFYLPYWDGDQMTAVWQTVCSNAFPGRQIVQTSLKFVTKSPVDNMPALVQITIRHRTGDKLLFEPMMAYFF